MEEKQIDLRDFIPNSETYWTQYNKAKCNEKSMFYLFLDDLCRIIQEPQHQVGRKPVPLRDLIFCACLKIYSNYSARKISSDMRHAEKAGFIKKVPHFNSLLTFMNNPITEQLLMKLITISAMPLKQLESDFAHDSTGFGCYQYERWMKVRFTQISENPEKLWRHFVKLHASIGTKTNVITAAEVTNSSIGDHRMFEPVAKVTAANFNVERYSMDKAYLSKKNMQVAQALEFIPFVPFKTNTSHKLNENGLWNRMYVYFNQNRAEFDKHYHRRSNVETTFSMIKMRLGEFLKCRNLQGQKNEVLLKCLVHNICCLVQETFESGIKIDFNSCDKKYVCT
ncbi:MAG: transposase [Nanoarchaeota archaeon]